MIWVTWRQHRTEFLIMGVVLVVCSAFLLITGLSMAQSSQHLGLAACLAHPAMNVNVCATSENAFTQQYGGLSWVPVVLVALVVVFGVFVGAPLVARELEQGTHRLIWTQNITRLRWLHTKLLLMLSTGILMFLLLFALFFWLYAPLYQPFTFYDRFSPPSFDALGPVLPAAAVLALALGVFTGTLTRRMVPAMFLTLILFLAIKFPVALALRPNYLPAITVSQPFGPNLNTPPIFSADKWITDVGMLDPHGNKTNQAYCSTAQPCGYKQYYTYQPDSRFWLFQWIETGIYLVLAILALGAASWLVKRRLN